jgi:1,4-dihydroxy-6-naphthoate synthase
LLNCGASFGNRYGPLVVSRNALEPKDLKGRRVAVPGKLTTAALVLRLYEPEAETVIVPFDQIVNQVVRAEVDAGVVIHEGQLTYANVGLSKILDLGEWWHQETQLPLPLGGNAILRSLDPALVKQVASALRRSIRYGLEHREHALAYASQFAPTLEAASLDRFVSMYVNEWTIDYGSVGRQAVATLLSRAYEKGLLPAKVNPEFIG